MIHQKFYIELGKLLYAVSKADNIIQLKEEKEIEKFVHDELNHHKSYFSLHPESKEIILTKLSFYNAVKENMKPHEAIESYKLFLIKYDHKIDAKYKKIASSLVLRIAKVFKGVNAAESKIIDQLRVSGIIQ